MTTPAHEEERPLDATRRGLIAWGMNSSAREGIASDAADFEAAVRADERAASDARLAGLACLDIDADVPSYEWLSALLTDVREAIGNGDWEHDDPASMMEAVRNLDVLNTRLRAALAEAEGRAALSSDSNEETK